MKNLLAATLFFFLLSLSAANAGMAADSQSRYVTRYIVFYL